MTSARARLRLAIVILAWLAQAFMPVAHAVAMSNSKSQYQDWCGTSASATAAMAVLPAELRQALDEGAVSADHLADCALLCAVGAPPGLLAGSSPVQALRAAGLEPAPSPLSSPQARSQSPTPPAQAPPARG